MKSAIRIIAAIATVLGLVSCASDPAPPAPVTTAPPSGGYVVPSK